PTGGSRITIDLRAIEKGKGGGEGRERARDTLPVDQRRQCSQGGAANPKRVSSFSTSKGKKPPHAAARCTTRDSCGLHHRRSRCCCCLRARPRRLPQQKRGWLASRWQHPPPSPAPRRPPLVRLSAF
ncbi:unnamed protein product, partial [Laminaria digitata]